MDNTAGRYPAMPMLLVRQAVLADDQGVASLLRDVPITLPAKPHHTRKPHSTGIRPSTPGQQPAP